ncbi:MFS transporter [Synechocystis sp. PCC 7509]|uniref:MFS transporter n=1 Tax=Synechocystis sp. PCC 7509 TaxID=927677 RepID=UPI0002AC44A6|nr:MFS transporter [Synechocystis sp. PCC 7509]
MPTLTVNKTSDNFLKLSDPKLLILLASGSLTTMAGGIVAPVLPDIVQQLQLDPGLAANLVSFHCLTLAIFSPLLGILADRIGRVKVLVASLLCYAVFGTAGAFMSSFLPLLVTRGLIGVASGGIAAASLGILGSNYEGEARSVALGYATSTLTITGILFPLLGGWVGSSHWQYAFYLYALGIPIAGLAMTFLQEDQTAKSTEKNYKLSQILGQRQTLWLLLTLVLVSVAMYSVVIYAPLYLKATIAAGAVLNGVVLASRAIGAAIVSAFGSKWLAQKFGLPNAIAFGCTLMAITLITIPLLHELIPIILTAIAFGVGFGIVLPNVYSALANLATPNLRSSVLALGTGAGFLGQFLSPIILRPMLNYGGLETVFYGAAIVAIMAGVLMLLSQDS